ncbi:hypothetical protein LWI29_015868 [Acer saccharum]|uniref:Zinc finger CCCH domain-containing protein 18-like n=1 Tax=Acer saccharum TaxID=4024 RepID=A0AA39T3K2_ACESA|nr:hypothetical protein LWI29_015868 [Acer saccharum]
MEFSESTRIVFNRVKKLEPENVTKIIGYLLLQDHGDQEMIHLAMSSDSVIQDFIYKIKAELHQLALKSSSPISVPPPTGVNESPFQFSPFSSRLALSPPLSFKSYWEHRVTAKRNAINEHQNQTQFLSLEDQMEQVSLGNTGDYYYSSSEAARARRYQALSELPVKICHYFNKGFCKHGSNCRYYHGQVPESFPQMFGHNSMDVFNDDHIFSPGSLENLEFEIVELLQSRRGNPISIASLPMLYYEKFGKVLQADGYLTESQRHGKAGYSLTKLLARLRNSIRLIDSRPHGQHAVILAEDASKYMDNRNERSDPGPIVSGSRQIYLTFPAESTFSEDDVSNYFSSYGPVEDVRIPCQQKRMFGFVTFASSDTVKMILAKGNPHFVCGARVLVKPYREKSKLVDRKYQERMDPSMYCCPQYSDMDSELHSFSRGCETSRLLRKQFMEEQEHAFKMEKRRLAELQLMQKPLSNQPCFGYSMNDLKVSEDHLKFPSAEHFNYLLDVLNNGGSTNDDKVRHVETRYTDQESDGLNLPDSPFASPIATGISTVI